MMSLFLDNLLIISWSLYITFSFEYLNSSWISYFTLICLALLEVTATGLKPRTT